MSNKNGQIVTVYPFLGQGALTIDQIMASGMIYRDAQTQQLLSGPARYGDIRPDGKTYHVGTYNAQLNTIAFHDPYKNKK